MDKKIIFLILKFLVDNNEKCQIKARMKSEKKLILGLKLKV